RLRWPPPARQAGSDGTAIVFRTVPGLPNVVNLVEHPEGCRGVHEVDGVVSSCKRLDVGRGGQVAENRKLGWVGAGGRMGLAMVQRLLATGNDVVVYNRTSEKLAPLLERGATPAGGLAELGRCDIVFVTLGGDRDFVDVIAGPGGLAAADPLPSIVV